MPSAGGVGRVGENTRQARNLIENMLTLTPVDCSEPDDAHAILDSFLDHVRRSHVHDGSHGYGKLHQHDSLPTGCATSDFSVRAIRRGLARARCDFRHGARRSMHFEPLAISAPSVVYISLVANKQRIETLDT